MKREESTERSSEGAPPGARAVAITTLVRVAEDGAYASRTLDAEVARAKLSSLDAALATEIVYGSLRVLPALDELVAAQLSRAPDRMDPLARAALRTACYQLQHLEKLPVHAIVHDTVSVVRAKRGPRVAGFVNAVLRKLAAARPAHPAPAHALVLPQWVQQELVQSLGEARARAFVTERALPPPLGLRVNLERSTREALRERILQAHPHAEVELSSSCPFSLCVRRAGSPRSIPGYADGHFTVQEEGAQLVALALGVESGERIADVCSGHGGKTVFFAQQLGPQGHVVAVDVDERKLEHIAPELKRLGIERSRADTRAVDLRVGLGGLAGDFDRVLVDAPCTGLGTLHRRPELLLRLRPSDVQRLADLQLDILVRAAALVKPGGLLAYAVCSPTTAEGLGVAERFEAKVATARRVHAAVGGNAALTPDADGVLRIGPWMVPGSASPASLGPSSLSMCAPDAYQVVLFRVGQAPG